MEKRAAGTPVRAASRSTRIGWLLLAYLSLGLGLIGLVLPVLPTTPFVLLAAWAAARGSPRLHAWLHGHPRFGPALDDWERQGAVPRRAKWLATVMMGSSAVLVALLSPRVWVSVTVTLVMACVAAWLWCRPEPLREVRSISRTDDPSG